MNKNHIIIIISAVVIVAAAAFTAVFVLPELQNKAGSGAAVSDAPQNADNTGNSDDENASPPSDSEDSSPAGSEPAESELSDNAQEEAEVSDTEEAPQNIMPYVYISTGDTTFARKSDDSLWAWGDNLYGEFGNGTTSNTRIRIPVKVMEDVAYATINGSQAMAIKTDGSLLAWGAGSDGLLGDGTMEDSYTPVKVLDDVAEVLLEDRHALALQTDGSLWAWGFNEAGWIGDGTNEERLNPVKILDDVVSFAAGDAHRMAIKSDNTLWAWGAYDNGRLGVGPGREYGSLKTPAKIMDDVVSVFTGDNCTMAIKTDGSLWAWGMNEDGQLGDGTTEDIFTPVMIMEGAADVSFGGETGQHHTAVLKTDGSLWVWGKNNRGQIGNGTTEDSHIPAKIMDGVASVTAGEHLTMAVKTDGSLWAWGANGLGQLGDGSTEDRLSPVKTMEDVSAVFLPRYANHAMALKTDGTIWAWGENGGKLGIGPDIKEDISTPVRVVDGE